MTIRNSLLASGSRRVTAGVGGAEDTAKSLTSAVAIETSGKTNRHAAFGEIRLGSGDTVFLVMENTGRKGGVGMAFCKHVEQVFGRAGAAAVNDGNAHRIGHGSRHGDIISGLG